MNLMIHRRRSLGAAIFAPLLLIGVFAAWAQSPDARDQYRRAETLLEEERYSRAAREFEEVFQEYPDDEVAPMAMYWHAFALYRIGDREDLEDAREVLQRALAEHGDDLARGEARELLERVEGQLARRGDPEAGRRIVNRARDDDADEELRMSALNALMHMDSDRAVPVLEKILDSPDKYSSEMRAQAIFILSQHGGRQFEEKMLDIVRNDSDPEVRQQAVFWLGQSNSGKALEVLSELLETESDVEVLEQVVFAIGQHGGREGAELLRDIALDKEKPSEIRENAVFWLGQTDDDNFVFLRELYGTVDSADMKEKIIFSISQQGGREQAAFLTQVMRDPNEDMEIRKNALFWLGQSGELDLVDVVEMYETLDDDEMREQAIFVIGQSGEREAAEFLIQIIRNEQDPELRNNAVFWLGQMDDDAAADFLEEIIAGGDN